MADDKEERILQISNQVSQAVARPLHFGLGLPNKFDDGDIVSWLDSFYVARGQTTGTMMQAYAALLPYW